MRQFNNELLDEIKKRIIEKVHPEKIILFGSHVWGKPDESSDIDLFVILPHSDQPSYRRARVIYEILQGIKYPIDIIVQTHDEVERNKLVRTSLVSNILSKGKVLYG